MRKPVPILFTIPNFITAGSGRVMVNILEGLDSQRFEPAVCVLKRGGSIEAELEARGIQLLELPFTIPPKPYGTLLQRARQVAKAFEPYKFDLWHSFHYADDYTEPLIARFAGAQGWIYTKKSMMWGSRAWILRSILATRIITDNKDMPKMFFNQFGLQKKVKVIAHGVNLVQFNPKQVDRDAYRLAYGLPDNTTRVGLVAHIVPIKGHSLVIEAASRLPMVHLMFAGRLDHHEYVTELNKQVEDLGMGERVHFLGNVTDIPSYLAQMDIIVMPSLKKGEGCPVALLEAMACGKACVATDVPGSRDIIEDGVSGLLVPAEDAQALADAIHRLVESPDLRQQLGHQARRRVEEHFTIEHEVAAHEQVYSRLLGLPS